jgi:hypothetical protein
MAAGLPLYAEGRCVMRQWHGHLCRAAVRGLCSAQALQLTDDRGVSVTLPRAPQRIVTCAAVADRDGVRAGPVPPPGGRGPLFQPPGAVRSCPGGRRHRPERRGHGGPQARRGADGHVVARRSSGWSRWALRWWRWSPKLPMTFSACWTSSARCWSVADAQRIWRVIDAGVTAAAQSLPPRVRATTVYFEVNRGPMRRGRVVHWRTADAAGGAEHHHARPGALSRRSTPSTWCVPTPTSS